jgi:hypothetical protein
MSNKPDPQKTRELIELNLDARRYFYSKADDRWFDWLWKNGFLEVIKEKAEDPTRYSYQTPELQYLVNVVEKIPAKVADFILTLPISQENFNPEVIDRLLWVASKMPASEIKRVVPKIRDEQWPRLMESFNRWGFEYKQMFKTLASASDHASIVVLAEAILLVRSKEEITPNPYGSGAVNPFFFNDLLRTEVFNMLATTDDANAEGAFRVATETLAKIVLIGEREDKVFERGEMFHLFDVDFFTVEVGEGRHHSYRADVKNLAAVVKTLAIRVIASRCGNAAEARKYYEKYILPLPDSRSLWRLRLFVWSQCPAVFKEELRIAFFRGIESEEALWPITGGAEYERALKIAFGTLSEKDRQTYFKQAIDLLGKEKDNPYGYGIFSSIYSFLSSEQIEKVLALYNVPLNPDYEPHASISRGEGGIVVPQTPEGSDEVWERSIPEIVEILKTTWAPAEIRKLAKPADFLTPVNAEGVADKLRRQIKERIKEYTHCALLFFDRNQLDAHYTYSYFRGIQEAIRENRARAKEVDWQAMFELGKAIAAEGKRESFDFSKRERESVDAWLSGWTAVHDGLADVIQEYLRDLNGTTEEHFRKYRDDVFAIIRYLLIVPDPRPEDEQPETAVSKSSGAGGEMLVSDPHHIAINSARGRGYEAFVFFMEGDARKFPKDAKIKISDDVFSVYKELLVQENTGAIRYLYGYYLPFFYYRAVEPVKELFPEMFTKGPETIHLYLAAWEGYLGRSLFKEVFDELQNEYERAINNDPSIYPKRSYSTDLDEGLAVHLALAYIHFKDFTLDSKLFKMFWQAKNKKRHQEFVAFIGRHIISRETPKDFLKEHPEVEVNKLMQFWDWLLANETDPDVFAEFGFWMNTTDGLYEDVPALTRRIRATLEKSNGRVNWEIRLMDSLPLLAEKAPVDTVEILRLYFTPLDMSPQYRDFMHVDADLVKIFRKLYQNPATNTQTHRLIDELLPLGNGAFWQLREVLT